MGNQINNQKGIYNGNFKHKKWQVIGDIQNEVVGNPSIIRTMDGQISADSYIINLDSLKNFQTECKTYQQRASSNSTNLVNILSAQLYLNKEDTREKQLIIVKTQRISWRLSQSCELNMEEGLYILEGALNGFGELLQYTQKPFLVTSRMIGLNSNGRVKIWLNENFSKNKLQNYRQITNTKQMMTQIIRIVQSYLKIKKFPPQVSTRLDSSPDFISAIIFIAGKLNMDKDQRGQMGKNIIKNTNVSKFLKSKSTRQSFQNSISHLYRSNVSNADYSRVLPLKSQKKPEFYKSRVLEPQVSNFNVKDSQFSRNQTIDVSALGSQKLNKRQHSHDGVYHTKYQNQNQWMTKSDVYGSKYIHRSDLMGDRKINMSVSTKIHKNQNQNSFKKIKGEENILAKSQVKNYQFDRNIHNKQYPASCQKSPQKYFHHYLNDSSYDQTPTKNPNKIKKRPIFDDHKKDKQKMVESSMRNFEHQTKRPYATISTDHIERKTDLSYSLTNSHHRKIVHRPPTHPRLRIEHPIYTHRLTSLQNLQYRGSKNYW